MNILIFIIVLGVLIFVHELGHFLFAKLFKIRADEFGFGYPPRMFKLFHWKGTDFTMNWIPFGGFVKIFGENDDGTELTDEEKKVSLIHKPRWQQFLVMFGGILFNIVFAWILFSATFIAGVQAPTSVAPENYVFTDSALVITGTMPDSPAAKAGLMSGDTVIAISTSQDSTEFEFRDVAQFSEFINSQGEQNISLLVEIDRNNETSVIEVVPEEGIISNQYAIGIGLEYIGTLKLPIFQALGYGAISTWDFLKGITKGFAYLFSGQIALDNVSGPVGIVKQVGDASALGFTYLITFTALISLNLAILNLIPFPALDGGRILIIMIESVIRRRLRPNVVNWVNTIGFFVLIGLMLVITANDIINLF